MRDKIDGAAFRDMIICAASALETNKRVINELNVFPVPDGDTGTNMSLTIGNAALELQKIANPVLSVAAETAAAATLRGARGNSGVIMSLLFRGISKSLRGKDEADAIQFAVAMAEGVDAAYRAVMKPAEGTILTVSREATKSAVEFADAGSDIELMLVCALESAKDALSKTVEQNPTLKRAGVIDAGAKGYVIMLDAMLASLQGRIVPELDLPRAGTPDSADFSKFEGGEITFAYCTEFIIDKNTGKAVEILRAYLESLGDSVVVVDDDELIKVHVHTDEPGNVLTEALTYGSLISIKVDNMREQHTELQRRREPDAADADIVSTAPEKKYGSVVICSGAGMEALFRELGADGIVSGGQTMNPSTEDILREISQTPAEMVFVFPNNSNIIMTAEQCVTLSQKKVVVIPTKSMPQGVAAMLGMDPYLDEDELRDVFFMAMDSIHSALVTCASRDSDFDGRCIKANEYLALLDNALIGSFADLADTVQNIIDAAQKYSPEFITIYYGADITEVDAQKTSAALGDAYPEAEVSLIDGGQPVYCYMISFE